MRCFFALNEASTSFWDYANLVQVAVHSARTHTKLQPVCLYDGADNALTDWLERAGVTIIRRRTFLHEWVTELAPIPRGAYLRLEIPEVCREQGWDDSHVLYTDCDVVFLRDPQPLLVPITPEFFAAAPEGDQTDFAHFNSGVMWINIAGLAAEQSALRDTIRTHLAEAIAPPYDQAALQRHFAGRATPLPLELNWKPYWGTNADAAILHFHGPKPFQKYLALNQRLPSGIAQWTGSTYYEACRLWDALLIDALDHTPWPPGSVPVMTDGFDSVATITTGIGDPEGPHPESNLPEVRWGLAPITRLKFEGGSGTRYRLEVVMQSPESDQAVSVYLDKRKITHVALTRLNDPYTINLDLGELPGQHVIEFQYGRAIQPAAPDPRQLGVMFRTLRIRALREG